MWRLRDRRAARRRGASFVRARVPTDQGLSAPISRRTRDIPLLVCSFASPLTFASTNKGVILRMTLTSAACTRSAARALAAGLLLGLAAAVAWPQGTAKAQDNAQDSATAGDPEAGRAKSFTCLGCHAAPGMRNAYPAYRVPKLAGQHAEYLAIALRDYREEKRWHPTMQSQAQTMSDQDIQDIAAYFSSLEKN